MKRRPPPRSTAHEVTCANEECEAPITVHVYPEEKETREVPAFPATIDTPIRCPACGALISNETANDWLVRLLEKRRDEEDSDV